MAFIGQFYYKRTDFNSGHGFVFNKNIKENIDVNVKEFNRQKTNILKHEQVLNQKFSLSVACLIFFSLEHLWEQ